MVVGRLGLDRFGRLVVVDGRCGGRDLDVAELGTGLGRRDGAAAEPVEVRLDGRAHALAVRRRVVLDRVGVGLQRVAACREVLDVGLEAPALALGDAPCAGLGLAHECLRTGFGLLDEAARLSVGLVHRVVGCALREHQRALQHRRRRRGSP